MASTMGQLNGSKVLAEESELVRKQACNSFIRCREKELAVGLQDGILQVVKERQSIQVVYVRNWVVEQDDLRPLLDVCVHRQEHGQRIGRPLPRAYLVEFDFSTAISSFQGKAGVVSHLILRRCMNLAEYAVRHLVSSCNYGVTRGVERVIFDDVIQYQPFHVVR